MPPNASSPSVAWATSWWNEGWRLDAGPITVLALLATGHDTKMRAGCWMLAPLPITHHPLPLPPDVTFDLCADYVPA